MKFKSTKSVLIAVIVFGLPALAFGDLITSEDFEAGATGWSNNTTTNGGSTFTRFLGRFGGTGGTQSVYKTYTLSGTQTEVTIEFDFYEIDSWDYERFIVFIDDTIVVNDAYQHTYDDVSRTSAISKLFGNGGTSYGFNFWSDQGFHYSLTYTTTASSLKLGFGSTLNQSISDESWGIDNVQITDNASVVPVPSSVLLGLIGLAPMIRRRRATK